MVFRQIEKVQKTVNYLLGLCTRNQFEETQPDEPPLSSEEKKHLRLGIMILKAQDGLLEQRCMLRLGKWLQCDDEALRFYLEFQTMTALLYLHFNENKIAQRMNSLNVPVS